MRKLFMLAVLALAGVGSAEATMYILGDESELGAWVPNAGKAMTAASDGTYYFTFTASASKDYYFCFSTALGTRSDDWTTFNANSYRPSSSSNSSYGLTFGLPLTNSNCILYGQSSNSSYHLSLESGTKYLIGFDPTNKRLVVTYDPSNVYILGGADGWHSNSGTTMTAGDDYIYTADFSIAEGAEEFALFAFTTCLSSSDDDWSSINNYRFGDENESNPTLSSFPIMNYGMRWTSANGGSYKIGTAGTYKIVLDYKMLKLSVYNTETVTTNAKGYCTYVNTGALNISYTDGVTAYYATDDNDGTATAHAITNPAASTPMLIKGAASTTYHFGVAASGTNYSSTNALHAGSGVALGGTDGGGYNYILKGDAFYLANSNTVAANKAYLKLSKAATSRVLNFIDDDETGINAIATNTTDAEAYYNLSGQRITNPSKGLYIRDGKKVIVK